MLEATLVRTVRCAEGVAVDGLELGIEPRQQVIDRGVDELLGRLAVKVGVSRVTGQQALGLVEHGKPVGQAFYGILEKLQEESGEIRRYVNVFVNDEDIRFLDGKETQLNEGDSVSIVPAIAGGC